MIERTGGRLLTIAETMSVLGCSRKTLYRLFTAEKLQRVYIAPRAPRVWEADLDAYLDEIRGVA